MEKWKMEHRKTKMKNEDHSKESEKWDERFRMM